MFQIKKLLIAYFGTAFAVCSLFVLIVSFGYTLLDNRYHDLPIAVFSLALFSLIVLLFFRTFDRWLRAKSNRLSDSFSYGFFAVMAIGEMVLITAFHAVRPPVVDGGHTYMEALYLLAHGHASGNSYFKVYPNNIPITLLRYFLYRLGAMIHFTNHMAIDRIFCAAMLDMSIVLSWQLIRRLCGKRTACFFLLLAMTCLPLFFYILYFYTDTVAIAFPVLLLYLWYLYSRSKQIFWLIALGVALGIGDQLRPNLFLFFPALAVYMPFVLKWRKVVINLVLIGMLLCSVGTLMQIVENHYGYSQDSSLAMPTAHWIVLGLSKNGGYDVKDYYYTRQQPNQVEKKQADLHRIKQRISNEGLDGLLRLWLIKTARVWGTGAHGYYWYTHLCDQRTKSYEYIFGHDNQIILFVIQVFYVVQIMLLVLSAVRTLRRRSADLSLLIQISLFGNFLFYVFIWEAEPRYSLLFTPYMLLGAVFGFKQFVHFSERIDKRQGHIYRKNELVFTGILIVVTTLYGVAGKYPLTKWSVPHNTYLAEQRYMVGKKAVIVDQHHTARQTFRVTQPYNRVAVWIKTIDGRGSYAMSIRDRQTGRPVRVALFSLPSASAPKKLVLKGNDTPVGRTAIQELTIQKISGSRTSRLLLGQSGKGFDQRDLYRGGYLSVNGSRKEKRDLQFAVYERERRPYLGNVTYWALVFVPIAMLVFTFLNATERLRRCNSSSFRQTARRHSAPH
ncbi:MAG: glycosyltransferase family 39 protein [Sporolactobacillus sp.]|nr:glycosyltransferase family 39 protein [Sporolactobacillus sp.]